MAARGPGIPLVPPGGFAGFAQQTPAVQALLRPPARRKKKTKKKTAKRRPGVGAGGKKSPRTTSRAKPNGRLIKGSAEAKRRMAQIRKKRKK